MRALLFSMVICGLLYGSPSDEVVPPVQRCTNALDACIDLTKNLDGSIQLLKQEVQGLEDRIADQENNSNLPWWVWSALGLLTGVTGYSIIHK
jgi:hypothetical protein